MRTSQVSCSFPWQRSRPTCIISTGRSKWTAGMTCSPGCGPVNNQHVILPKGHTVPAVGAGAASGRCERPSGAKNPSAFEPKALETLHFVQGDMFFFWGKISHLHPKLYIKIPKIHPTLDFQFSSSAR